MALDNPGDYEDDGFWDAPPAAAPAPGGYSGPVPQGFTQSDVEDFLRRNPGDEHRVSEALVRGGAGGGGAAPAVSSAPQSIQPYGQTFGFDPANLGKTEGFKFKFDKAIDAIRKLGAAKGSYFNPQTWKAAEAEATGLAGQDVNEEYGRQADTFDRNFGVHQWNEGSRFDSQRANRGDDFTFMNTDRNFNRGVLESDRGFGYQKNRDDMGDMWRFVDYSNQTTYAR